MTELPELKLILADDHDLVRSGIKALLNGIEGVAVIAEARDGVELLSQLLTLRPDVVLTDVDMPVLDGFAAAARIAADHPQVRVLMLSAHDDVETIRRAIACGACGYLMKEAPAMELELALRSVMQTGRYFSPGVAQKLLAPAEPTAHEELTPRQIEILVMLATGKSSKEIGFELGLSSKTVDVHRARIMARLGLSDLASLTRYAMRKGLIAP